MQLLALLLDLAGVTEAGLCRALFRSSGFLKYVPRTGGTGHAVTLPSTSKVTHRVCACMCAHVHRYAHHGA